MRIRPSQFRTRFFPILFAAGVTSWSGAQTPTVNPRLQAMAGPASTVIVEPAIGAAPWGAVALAFTGDAKAWWADHPVARASWAEGLIADGDSGIVFDVSIAYDSATDGFLAAAGADGYQELVTCRYDYDPQSGSGQFKSTGWNTIASVPLGSATSLCWSPAKRSALARSTICFGSIRTCWAKGVRGTAGRARLTAANAGRAGW